jgi:hypothetical protein
VRERENNREKERDGERKEVRR